jgi:hypothetical protein
MFLLKINFHAFDVNRKEDRVDKKEKKKYDDNGKLK